MGGLVWAFLTFWTSLFLYYNVWVKKRPRVHSGHPKLRTFLGKHVPLLRERFGPSPLYFEGRMQTILQFRFRDSSPKFFAYRREIFCLKDGGECALDFSEVKPENGKKEVIILLFPGITSTSQTNYVRTVVNTLNKVGASVVVFNQRGLAGVPYKTPRIHSASNIEDAEEVINYLKEKYPSHRRLAFAFSLGGMILCKYLYTRVKEAAEIFEAAVIISVLWECDAAVKNMEDDFFNRRWLNRQLADSLIHLTKKLLKTMEPPKTFNVKAALKAKTVREFDVAVTVPHFGWDSVEEYYYDATTLGHCHKFSIPVFALNAEDDPMCLGEFLPKDEALVQGSKLALVTTTRGGHLGFLEGIGNKPEHFMERFVEQVVGAIITHGERELKL